MRSARSTSTLAAAGLALIAAGCTSGQTGSPAEQPPRYETPGRFSPRAPGPPTGNPGIDPDTNRETYSRQGGDFGALLDPDHLVVAVDGRGVLVFDVSDGSAPRLAGELAIIGRPFQLEVDTDTRSAGLVVLERTPVESEQVPADAAGARLRLIHVDLRDASAPRRVAAVDLTADFWQFVRRGERYFVLSQLYQEPAQACEAQAQLPPGRQGTRAMRVTSFALGADGFTEQAAIELPADAGYAFVTADAIFVVDHYRPDGAPQALGFVDFGSGSLREGAPAAIDGRLLWIDRRGGAAIALLERNGVRFAQTFALAEQRLTAQGELQLPAGAPHVEPRVDLLGDGGQAVITGGGSGALLLDLNDLTAPQIAQRFPAEVERLLPVSEGLLGLGASTAADSQGRLVVTLWQADGAATPVAIGRVLTAWPSALNYDPGLEGYTLEAERQLLLLPIWAANLKTALGVVTWDADSVSVHSQQPTRAESLYRPLSNGERVFAPSWEGLEILPLEAGAAPEAPESVFVAYAEPKPTAQLTTDGFALAVRERPDDGRFVVDVEPEAGGALQRIELEHRVDGLIALGDRVLALGLRWDGECDYMEQSQGEGYACADYRARGLSVLAFDPEPRVVATIAIDSGLDAPELPDVRAISTWSGYFELGAGRIVFLAEQRLECSSRAGCDALQVMAGQTRAAPGCNPQVQDCSMLPREVILTSGSKTSLLLYTLEGAQSEAPALQLAAQIEGRYTLPGEGPLDVGWQLLRSGTDIGFAREERVYDANGNGVDNQHGDPVMRFWLDRIVERNDGTFEALPSVNTPGRPVAWRGDHVYSIEPSYADGDQVLVRLHSARIDRGGAFIEASRELGRGFVDARALGDQLFALIGPTDPCAADPSTRLFATDLGSDALEAGSELVLPGRSWSFPYGPAQVADGELIVRGGPAAGGWARIDISNASRPRLLGYSDRPQP